MFSSLSIFVRRDALLETAISEQRESTPTTASGTIAARDGELHPAFADTAISDADGSVASNDTLIDSPRDDQPSSNPADSGSQYISGNHRLAIRASGQVDNYRIIDELGSGGMAVVYRAEDTRLHRQVALKILHDHIANRPENRERFEREARAVARLKHPNIMSVYGFSTPSAPVGYIAAELIDGETMRQFVDRRGFAFPEVGAMVCLKLAEALSHAHESGIIHRDFKPENVMITRDGVPKLMDFGLARLLDHQTMTMTGAVLGSPAHMSPEAIEGKPVDRRVDIFAFGTVLYYATTGRLPYDGRNPAVILNAILVGRYADPTMANPRNGARLARIISTCLETDPDDRYATVGALTDELKAYLAGLGLHDVQGELSQFFADPDGYDEALKPRLTDRLAAQADTAMAENRMAAALALCDQILAIEEGHPAALRVLGQANTRLKVRRVLAGILAVLLLTSVSWAFIAAGDSPISEPELDPSIAALSGSAEGSNEPAFIEPDPPEPTPDPVLSAVSEAASTLGGAWAGASASILVPDVVATAESVAFVIWRDAAAQASLTPRRVVIPAAVLAATEGSGEGEVDPPEGSGETEVASAERVSVTIRVAPPTAMVRIDGQDRGAAPRARDQLLEPGTHTIELHVPGARNMRLEETFEVTAGGVNDFAFRVPWPDAYMEFNSEVPGNVIIDGVVYRTDERVRVSIDGSEPSATITVEFVPPVGQPTRTEVLVRTEQVVSVRAPF